MAIACLRGETVVFNAQVSVTPTDLRIRAISPLAFLNVSCNVFESHGVRISLGETPGAPDTGSDEQFLAWGVQDGDGIIEWQDESPLMADAVHERIRAGDRSWLGRLGGRLRVW